MLSKQQILDFISHNKKVLDIDDYKIAFKETYTLYILRESERDYWMNRYNELKSEIDAARIGVDL